MDYDAAISSIMTSTGCDYATAEYTYSKFKSVDKAIACINESNLYVGNGQAVQKKVTITEYNNGILINDKFYPDKERILKGIKKGEIDRNILQAQGDYVDVNMVQKHEDYKEKRPTEEKENKGKSRSLGENTAKINIEDNYSMDRKGIMLNLSLNKKRVKLTVEENRTIKDIADFLCKTFNREVELKSIVKNINLESHAKEYKGGLIIVKFK